MMKELLGSLQLLYNAHVLCIYQAIHVYISIEYHNQTRLVVPKLFLCLMYVLINWFTMIMCSIALIDLHLLS